MVECWRTWTAVLTKGAVVPLRTKQAMHYDYGRFRWVGFAGRVMAGVGQVDERVLQTSAS